MKPNIAKLILRETIILLASIVVSAICIFVGIGLGDSVGSKTYRTVELPLSCLLGNIAFYNYPSYLLIRFVVWAKLILTSKDMAIFAKRKRICWVTIIFLLFIIGLGIKSKDFPNARVDDLLIYGKSIWGDYVDTTIPPYYNWNNPFGPLYLIALYKYYAIAATFLTGLALFIATKRK